MAGALPIEITRSNVEATKEDGEPLHGTFGAKGRSVWFEWEATSSGFVTVGNCGSDFTTVVAVYTGAAIGELTQVAGDFATASGPGCATGWGRQVTFEASAGTVYKIAVDGDPFYVPPSEPPTGEGTFGLQIEMTPAPPNDDFADAAPLVGSVEEEPGASTAFYWATGAGYNWNATKEPGEPDHDDNPGGASVWYSWTAPATGAADIGTCEGKPLVVGVYLGGAVDALTPVGSSEFFGCTRTVSVSAGVTYRIAVDGKDEGGAPARRSFQLTVRMRLPARLVAPPSPSPGQAPVDGVAPDTMIAKRMVRHAKGRATFSFRASEQGSTFRCKLDKRPFRPCASPRAYRNVAPGRHVFRVVAVDAAGNMDPSPAVARFRIAARPTPTQKTKQRY